MHVPSEPAPSVSWALSSPVTAGAKAPQASWRRGDRRNTIHNSADLALLLFLLKAGGGGGVVHG